MRKKLFIMLMVLAVITTTTVSQLYAEADKKKEEKHKEEIVFSGLPNMKISEAGISRVVEEITGDKAIEYKCTITKIKDKYYWTTRENKEMVPVMRGAYITFIAVNGSGYVRVIRPEMKKAVSLLDDTVKSFDYVEHLLLGLKSVTYYGN